MIEYVVPLMLSTCGAGVQMSELKLPPTVDTVPETEPTVVPMPVVGFVWLMASVNITAPGAAVTLPVPWSWKLPRLTMLPFAYPIGSVAFGRYVSVKPPPGWAQTFVPLHVEAALEKVPVVK